MLWELNDLLIEKKSEKKHPYFHIGDGDLRFVQPEKITYD